MMNSSLNGNKVIKALEQKRQDVNFFAYKILSILLNHYETRLEKDPLNLSPITYVSKKSNQDLYNKFDLDQLTRSNGKYTTQSRTFYYMTVVQVLDQLVFGINGVNISISKVNNYSTTQLSIPRKLMDEKYELVKALVRNVKPVMDGNRVKKNKKETKKNNIIINDEIVIPQQKVTIEIEDNSNLPTVL